MLMNRYLRTCTILTLIFLMILPRLTAASDVNWQIIWQEDGRLQEEVKITGRDIVPIDQDWNIRHEGDQYILSREVGNWSSYQQSKDKLPLQLKQSNYIVFKQTKLDISDYTEGLFSQLNSLNGFHLTMTVPGFIFGRYGERIDEFSSSWLFANSTELIPGNKILEFVTIDGLLSGIVIFSVGLFAVVINFVRRLKKADQIIEEEFSIEEASAEQDTSEEHSPEQLAVEENSKDAHVTRD